MPERLENQGKGGARRQPRGDDRAGRLAEALRANLRRRKMQARGRGAPGQADASAVTGPSADDSVKD
jgi:hypothetical protein